MESIFSQIIKNKIPCHKIAEDENHLAFLDINPNAIGHTLCIPKSQIDRLFDLEQSSYLELMIFSRKVALALEKAVKCNRVGLSVVGLEIPHAHVHLIPINSIEDISFQKKVTLSSEELKILALRIKSYM